MESIVLYLDETTLQFYRRIAACARRPVEAVLSDALFKLAGELSMEAISRSCGSAESLV